MLYFNPITEQKLEKTNPLNLIWDKLKPIKYGSYDTKEKKFTEDIGDENYRHIKILTPEETLKYRYGTCYEQAILTAYLAKKHKLPYSCEFFLNKNGNTHLICCVQYKSKWYWIEHAWGRNQKIHGPFASIKEIDQHVSDIWTKSYKSPIIYKKQNFDVEKFFTGFHLNPEITHSNQ